MNLATNRRVVREEWGMGSRESLFFSNFHNIIQNGVNFSNARLWYSANNHEKNWIFFVITKKSNHDMNTKGSKKGSKQATKSMSRKCPLCLYGACTPMKSTYECPEQNELFHFLFYWYCMLHWPRMLTALIQNSFNQTLKIESSHLRALALCYTNYSHSMTSTFSKPLKVSLTSA